MILNILFLIISWAIADTHSNVTYYRDNWDLNGLLVEDVSPTAINKITGNLFIVYKDTLFEFDYLSKSWNSGVKLEGGNKLKGRHGFYLPQLNQIWTSIPGVGIVHTIDVKTGEVNRIDQSFHHKNQYYAGIAYTSKPSILAFGGYGFWQVKNIMSEFDPNLKEWNIISYAINQEYPEPRTNSWVFLWDNESKFTVLGGSSLTKNIDQIGASQIALADVWTLNMKSKLWEKSAKLELGESSETYNRYPNNFNNTAVDENQKLGYFITFDYLLTNTNLFKYNFVNKTFSRLSVEIPDFRDLIGMCYKKEEDELIVYTFKNDNNEKTSNLAFFKIDNISKANFIDFEPKDNQKLYLLLFFFTSTIITFLVYKVKSSNKSELKKECLTFSIDQIENISQNEITVLKLLSEKSQLGIYVSVDEIEEVAFNFEKNYDYRRRLRVLAFEKIGKQLNEQFDIPSNKWLISRRNANDKRRFEFLLNPIYFKANNEL